MSEKKANWLIGLVIALIALQLVTLVRVNWLNNEMGGMEKRVSNLDWEIRNNIASISSNLRQQLEQEASIIDSYAYEFGELDAESLTLAVSFTVSPKQLAADTGASLELNGESFPMERRGDSFIASVDADLFEVFQQPKIILETGGLRQQETIEMGFDPRYEALPEMYAWLDRNGGSATYQAGDGGGTYYLSGAVQIDTVGKTSLGLQSSLKDLRLIVEVDDEEVWRLDETDFPNSNTSGGRSDGSSVFMDIDQPIEFSLRPGQSLCVYAQAEDGYGIIHQVLLEQVVLDENGEPGWDEGERIKGEEMLLDKKGNVLWQPEYY